jgi:RHS repeat-associated protein
VTKYDGLGRMVITGKYYSTTATRASLQTTADTYTTNLYESFTNATTFYGYSNLSWPDISTGTNNKVLTVNYYDTYDVIGNTSVNPGSTVFTAPSALIDTLETAPKGMPVATLVNVLGTTNYLFTVTHYDKDGNAVKTISQHYQGGTAAYNKYDSQESTYSFQGLPLQSTRKHYLPASTSPQLTINSWNTYDHLNRPLLAKQQLITPTNTGTITNLSKTDYNEIGQASTKHLHSTNAAANPANSTFLQHVDFRYNSRGWLTKINDPTQTTDQTFTSAIDVFSEQLDYEQTTNGYTITPQYNGNISSVKWQSQNPSALVALSVPQEQKGYIYSYDYLNRLTNAISKAATSGDNLFNETVSYDELGNILTLSRNRTTAASVFNNLTYSYTTGGVRSNILRSVTDNGTVTESQASTYTYNTMGSITGDTKKAVTGMAYNELNLPATVPLTGKTLYYIYDASGRKLEKTVKNGNTLLDDRSYVSGIEYVGNIIEFVATPVGRALAPTGGLTTYGYEYQLTDHLGNVRVTFGDLNNNGILTNDEILQISDYYPFGRESNGFISGTVQRYKYNGKELQDDLNQYDYGARFYDPVIGRWNVIDPLAEKSRRFSPYVYGDDNPIRNIDPDGMETQDCCGLPSLLKRFVNYAVNKTKNSINNAIVNTAKDIKDGIKSEFNKLQLSVYGSADGKVTVGARISGGVKGALKGDINAGSVTLLSGNAETDSKAGTSGNFNYIMKDGKYERSFGSGGDILGGLSGGVSETINDKGKIVERTVEGGGELGFLQTKGQLNQSNGKVTPVGTISAGFSPTLGLIFNYSSSVNVGIKITRKSDDD